MAMTSMKSDMVPISKIASLPSNLRCKKSRWDTFVVNEGVGGMISFVGRSVSFDEYGLNLMYFVC